MLGRGAQLGHFRIESVVGRGATATVYEARDLSVDRLVALKVLTPELSSDPVFSARFRREAHLQASLEHPHIVAVYHAAASDDGLYIAMRLINGPTLASLIARHALSADRALRLLGQVAGALDAAHDAGLVHRDIKPQNVLIDREDSAYLSDFGLTKVTVDAGLTVDGGIVGTLAYLAPEVIRGARATAASDLYGFAAMTFECMTGRRVFVRDTEAAVLYAHTSEPPPPVSEARPGLPAQLDDIFAAALAKVPGERTLTATALIDALRHVVDAQPQELAPPPAAGTLTSIPAIEPAAPGSTRRLWQLVVSAGAGAAVAVAVLAVAGAFSRSGSPTPVSAAAPGTTLLGSALTHPGRQMTCLSTTGDCTVVQTVLPHATLDAPHTGVIRRWTVRGASGELALQVLTERAGRVQQLARSQSAFVPDDRAHSFSTRLELDRGDFVGLELVSGARVGVRTAVPGARLARWTQPISGSPVAARTGHTSPGSELLLGANLAPAEAGGGVTEVSGVAAASIPDGQRVAHRQFTFSDGQRSQIALVQLAHTTVLDEFRRDARQVRILVPDALPGGRVITFAIDHSPSDKDEVGVYLEYVNQDSQRVVAHYFLVHPTDISYVD